MPRNVIVREYESSQAFEDDASYLADQGWRVQTVTYKNERSGCLRGCLLMLFALIWKPVARQLTVTYTRS